ncbi:N-acetylmuramoyl-L-alanine amidase [Streptomyces sp. NPDC008121]|uniref:N-acetylmuramoyl-L-alanine amidase n=1 Tax=Streptomyces sp. NPDC008121 TaxID=3364809 RepID=UPI0036ED6A82
MIVLGTVSLTAPIALAGTSTASPAIAAKAGDHSQNEDTVLTGGTGTPSSALPEQAASGKTFTTGEITGKHFSSIGLSWKKDSAAGDGLTAQARIHREGAWEPWREVPLELDEGMAGEAERAGSPAFYTGDADGAELRFTSPQGSLPQDLRLSFIDPAPGTAASSSGRQAGTAQAGQPEVKLRKDWGADETLADPGYKLQPSLKAAVVHHTDHTATGSNTYTREEVPQIINGIYVHVIRNLGYGDFPYHFVVDRFGGIWEGRKGSVEMQPGTEVPGIPGGHARGFNTGSFGVAMLGSFEPHNRDAGPGPQPSEAMVSSLADVLAWKGSQYQMDPEGSTQLVSGGGGGSNPHPAGTVLDVNVISSHRDVNTTSCPGGKLYDMLPELRKQVAQRTGQPRSFMRSRQLADGTFVLGRSGSFCLRAR